MCNNNVLLAGRGGAGAVGVQRAISCGFNPGFAHFNRQRHCGPTHLKSVATHNYPITCEPPRTITIDRVTQISGVDNALFLIGDADHFRMGKNFQMELPGEAINVVSGNFPTYLLLKAGDLHTLGFSTANIEAVMRQNRHMFSRDGILRADLSLFPDLAPQDMAVEGLDQEHCKPEREFRTRIISNTTLNDASTTIEITVFECGTLIDREIWYVIPVRCENGHSVMGANLAAWDVTPRTCGEMIFIPCRSTNNGQLVVANYPNGRCGRTVPGGFGHYHRGGLGNGYGW